MAIQECGELTIQVEPTVQTVLVDQWLEAIQVDAEGQKEAPLSACIFRVPKTLTVGLKDKDKEAAEAVYKPQIVPLGPFHFREHQDLASLATKIKSAVVRSLESQPNLDGKNVFFEIVQRIEAEKSSIKGCYDRLDTIFDSEVVLHWMMARDAIFILQFLRQRVLLPDLRSLLGIEEQLLSKYLSRKYEHIRGGEIESLPLLDTVKDIMKLENQIPVSTLQIVLSVEKERRKVTDNGEAASSDPQKTQSSTSAKPADPKAEAEEIMVSEWVDKNKGELVDKELRYVVENTCRLMSPIKKDPIQREHTADEDKVWLDDNRRHILASLHSYVVSNVVGHEKKPDGDEPHRPGMFNRSTILFSVFKCFLFIIMYPFIFRKKKVETTILPPATRLDKAGVEFKSCHGGIEGILFDDSKHTLYLPSVEVDIRTESVMRNMMAFELCSSFISVKAVTRYAHFMDQLIDDDQDVEILRESGIIDNRLGSDSKVADLWNSLSDSTYGPSCPPIDIATTALERYYKRRTTFVYVLWKEFLAEYCSKPWHIIALVASAGVIVMTALEVNCAYHPCVA